MAFLNRREFLGGAGALALGAGLGLGAARPGRKPNIVFILADDLGYGDPSCYGQTKFGTPNIDRLAAEGMRFTQAYAGSTVCAPSRCALMTGYHMGHAHIRGNRGGGGVPLRPQDLTVTELLKQAGYATGMFGKWGLGLNDTTGQPNRKGFDEWFGYLDQSLAHFYYTDHLYKNSEKFPIAKTQYSHDLIAEAALEFIRKNKDKPFFLYLPFTIPHASLQAPEDSLEKFRGKFPEVPFPGAHYTAQPTPRAAFAAMVTRLDRDVGRVVALLKQLGIEEDTVIFFSSDNGPHREGGHDPDFFRSAGPLRGIKRDLYEGGIRVPTIARWPGKIRAGVASDQVWAFWDFPPTAAEIAGLKSPQGIDGISILPALTGKPQKNHEYLYWEFFEKGFKQAIRVGDWKAVRMAPGKPLELYNLKTDIGEQNNIARKHPDVIARIEEILNTVRTDSEHWPVSQS